MPLDQAPEPRQFLLADGTIGDEVDAAADEVRQLEEKLTFARRRLASKRMWKRRRETEAA